MTAVSRWWTLVQRHRALLFQGGGGAASRAHPSVRPVGKSTRSTFHKSEAALLYLSLSYSEHFEAIFVGNHNNQFMDASMLVANIPRQLRFLVAMKSMKRRVIGLLSRLAGGIPVVRQDDLAAKGEGLVRVSHHFTSASHVCPPPPHHHHIHPRRHAENTDNTSNSSRCSSVSPSPAGTAGAGRRPGKGDEEEKEEDEERPRRGAGAGGGKGEQADLGALQVAVTEVEAARRRGTNERAAAEEGAAAGAGAGTQEQQRREGSGQQANFLSAAKGRAAGAEAAEEEEKGISSWWRAVRSPAQRTRRISDAAAANVAAAADKIAEFEGDAAVGGADSAPATAGREGRGAAAAASREKPGDRNEGELLVAASGSTQPAIAAAQSRPPLLSILGERTRFLRDCSAGCKLLIEKQHYSIVKVLSDTHLLATAVETEAPHSMLKRSSSERAVAPAGGEGGEDVAAAGLEVARSRRDGAAALGARDNPRSSSERRRRRRAAEAASVARGRSSSGEREHHVRRSLRRGGRSSSNSRSKSARPANASNASMHAAAAGQGKGFVSAVKPGAAGTAALGPAAGGAAPAAGAGEEEREREGGDGTTAASLLRAQGEAAKDTDVWRDATILQSVSSDDATPAACGRFAVRDDASAAGTGKREWVYSEELSSRDSAEGGFSPVSSNDSGKQTSSGEHTHNGTSDNASRSSSESGSSSSSESRAGTSAEERVNREDDTGESAAVQARKEQEENNKNEKQKEMEEQLAEGGGLRRRRGGRDATPDAAEPTAAAISRNNSLQLPSTVTGEGAAAASRMFLSPSSSQHTLPRQYGDRQHYRDRLAATYKPYKIIPHVDQRKVYEDVSRSLIEGDCIGIFPEGGSHDRTTLLPLKAGVAIMALQGLAAGAEDVMIVPVGLTYHNPHKTQSRATVCIGDPIPISRELAVEYERDRRAATTQILSDVEKGLRSCIITAQDHETILLIKLSCSLYPPERLRLSPEKYFNLNQLLSKLFWRCSEEPELLKLRQGLVQYQGSLARAGIPDHDVWMLKQSTAGASLYFAEKLIALAYSIAFGVPLLPLWGPLRVLARILAEAHRAKALAASSVKVKGTDVVASYKVIVLLVCVPLFNILYGALVGFFFLDSWKETLVTILLCVCLLPVSYYVSMRRAERILPLMRQIRTLIMVLVGKVNVWRENERELVTQRTEMQLCVRDTLFHVGPRTSPTFIDELYAIVPKAVLDADTKRLVRKKEDFAPLQMKYLLNNADEIL